MWIEYVRRIRVNKKDLEHRLDEIDSAICKLSALYNADVIYNVGVVQHETDLDCVWVFISPA